MDLEKGMQKIFMLTLSASMAILTGILAQAAFSIGPIPYTMQNTGIILSGLLLPPLYAAFSQFLYLTLIAIGFPMASGLKGGFAVLMGYTGGYLIGFPISSFVMSVLSRKYLRLKRKKLYEISLKDFAVLLAFSAIAVVPVYLLGFLVFTHYALSNERLLNWSKSVVAFTGANFSDPLFQLFISSVAVFVPQDLFMDHVVAIVVAKHVTDFLRYKGMSYD